MSDRPARNEDEHSARREIAGVVSRLLRGELSFLEGAVSIGGLREKVGGISDQDPDFNIFSAIASETDNLPRKDVQHLWAHGALEPLAPEFRRAEEWAAEFGRDACKSLLSRFGQNR